MRSDVIIGAIGGDIIGSPYEFIGAREEEIELFKEGCCTYTDDTVLTMAVADWALHREKPVKEYLLEYARDYHNVGYGPMFCEWMYSPDPQPYNSCGNGSAMRVGAVGCVAKSVNEAIELAKESAIPTHNHPEGIKGAQAIAAAVFMARNKCTKSLMKYVLKPEFGYDIDRSFQEIYHAHYTFNVTCQTTVPEALVCFFESENYEDCIRKAMLTNMDTDTAAAVAGAVAGAYYGIDDKLREKVLSYLPDEFKCLIAEYDKGDQ
jgi:ADP-ribosylglycohydrolase